MDPRFTSPPVRLPAGGISLRCLRKDWRHFVLTCCFACFGVTGSAQEAQSPSGGLVGQLPERLRTEEHISVTTTRTEAELDRVPASVSVLEREDISQRQGFTLSDVLGKLPNVEDNGSARPSGQILSLRGYTGSELTQLVDGARLNYTHSFLSALYLDPEFLERVEVVRGSTSSLYGSGGLGGALALQTKSARNLLGGNQAVGGYLKSGYSSAASGQRYHGAIYGKTEHLDGLLGFGYANSDDIRQGGGTYLRPDHYHGYNGLLNAGVRLNRRTRVQVSDLFLQSREFMSNNPQADASFPYLQNNHVQQQVSSLRLDRSQEEGRQGLSLVMYRTASKFRIDANPAITGTVASSNYLTTWGGGVLNLSRFGHASIGAHTLGYGLDYYRDEEGARSGGAANPVVPDGTQGVLGLFAQDEIILSTRCRVIASLRYDRYATTASGQESSTQTRYRFSPKGTVSFNVTPSLMLYGSGASGFRAPALIELYSSYSIPTGFSNFKPNPALAAEDSTQGEGGAIWHGRGVFRPDDGLRFRAALFATHDNQLIEQIVVGTFNNPRLGKRPVLQYVNVQAARRWGVEWEGEYLLRSLQISGAYSRVRVSDRQSGEHLYSPPDKGMLHINYWLSEGHASLSWVSTAVARQDYDSTLTRRRSGWTTHDAFVSVFWGATGKYRLDAGAANLFDKRYSIYKSNASYPYVPEAGRDVRISLTTHF